MDSSAPFMFPSADRESDHTGSLNDQKGHDSKLFHGWRQQQRQRRNLKNWLIVAAVAIASIAAYGICALMARGNFGANRFENSAFITMKQHSSSSDYFSFRILQLADIHLGEAPYTDWGPVQDMKSFACITTLIEQSQPDFIVLSGDQLTANNIDTNATIYYRQLLDLLSTFEIPWCIIFGNHDDAPFVSPREEADSVASPKTSRQDLIHLDQSYAPLSRTKQGPSNVHGVSNFAVDIHHPIDTSRVLMRGIFMDTGGGSSNKTLQQSQLDWLEEQLQQLSGGTPSFVFQHIPTKEFSYSNKNNNENDNKNENVAVCSGENNDGGIDPLSYDAGLIQQLYHHLGKSTDNNGNNQDGDNQVLFVAVGHMHGNDYCCPLSLEDSKSMTTTNTKLLTLCFGRHSGYGGYGTWDRGARVYDFRYDKNTNTMTWDSFVQMESGEIINAHSPL